MSMEQQLQQQIARNNGIALEKFKKSLTSAKDEPENNPMEGFDCNICLDAVQDPVVTLCGHLYCWPCIYKWIHTQSVPSEDSEHKHPQCPVCKDEVSEKTMIPLYGRGLATPKSSSNLGLIIPQRPQSPRCGAHMLIASSPHPSPQIRQRDHPQSPLGQTPYIGSPMSPNVLSDPMTGMFGEMVYTRMFGNSETTLHSYPSSFNLAGSNLRMRRQMMNADRSLSRICFFLFCCLVLCLLLF